jgi:hypothetical protein
MKIILSRKGLDSGYGGHPSPIMPDGTLLSFPIPSQDEKISYRDIHNSDGITYLETLKKLIKGKKFKDVDKKFVVDESFNFNCHLDPDLESSTLIKGREKGWLPSFGQTGASQTHLANEGVGKDDVFLFFGWFKKTEIKNGKLSFVRDAYSDVHLIWGYLQIGEILNNKSDMIRYNWLKDHPHYGRIDPNNTIYLSKQNLSWDGNLPGAGILNFDEKLILTTPNHSRTKWNLDPTIFKKLKITYHSPNSWKDEYFKSADKGQEFVVHADKGAIDWAKKIISN